eukprot:scaffold28329_cov137-Skeletonema_menzelii.AAC.3
MGSDRAAYVSLEWQNELWSICIGIALADSGGGEMLEESAVAELDMIRYRKQIEQNQSILLVRRHDKFPCTYLHENMFASA